MIYLSDDYVTHYCDALSYLISRSYHEGYTFDHIEKTISYSRIIEEFERSNITLIAFTSMQRIYDDIFKSKENNFVLDIYDEFGWAGSTYMHLFLSMNITFEALFNIIPIKKMLDLYKLYHEMSFSQILDYAKSIIDSSLLDVIMKNKGWTNERLAKETNINIATIKALRYGYRDIRKTEADKLLSISRALNIKMETLLPDIHLIKQN